MSSRPPPGHHQPGTSHQRPPPPPGSRPLPPGAVPRPKNWKLLVDPELRLGHEAKLFRVNGECQEDPTRSVRLPLPDPRHGALAARFRSSREETLLLLPCFTMDGNFVGKPPRRETSWHSLNDNVSEAFLRSLAEKCGDVVSVKVFHHPDTKRHLGIGLVGFGSAKAAAAAVERHHNRSLMGRQITVLIDPGGREVKRAYRRAIGQGTPEHHQRLPRPHTPTPPPAGPSQAAPVAAPPLPPVPPEPLPPQTSPGIPEDPMVAKDYPAFPSVLPAPPPFLARLASDAGPSFAPPVPVGCAPVSSDDGEARESRRRSPERRRRSRPRDEEPRRSSRPRDQQRREPSRGRESRWGGREALETVSSDDEEARRRKDRRSRRSPSPAVERERSRDRSREQRRPPAPPPETSPPSPRPPSPELSLEHRIQSILREAGEEVLKVVSEEKKAGGSRSASRSAEVITLDDEAPSSSQRRQRSSDDRHSHRRSASRPEQRSTERDRGGDAKESRKPRRVSRFDQPPPNAPRHLPPQAWAGIRLPPPGAFTVPPPGYGGPFVPPPPRPPRPQLAHVLLRPPPIPPMLHQRIEPVVLPPPPALPRLTPPEPPEKAAERVVDDVLHLLSKDLCGVLERDMNRRLVETSVVGAVDRWWDDALDRERRKRSEEESRAETLRQFSSDNAQALHSIQEQASQSIHSAVNAMFGASESVSGTGVGDALEEADDVGMAGLPGYGLKASMPKIRFKKKPADTKKEPNEDHLRSKSQTPDNGSVASSAVKEVDISSSEVEEDDAEQDDSKAPSRMSSEAPRETSQSPSLSSSAPPTPAGATSPESDDDSDLEDRRPRAASALSTASGSPSPSPVPPKAPKEKTRPIEEHRPQSAMMLPPSPPALSAALGERKEAPPSPRRSESPQPPRAKRPRAAFAQRDEATEESLLELMGRGVDVEDLMFLQRAFEALHRDPASALYHQSRWVPHPVCVSPQKSSSSCARTEGYRKNESAKRSFMRRVSALPERTQQQSQADVAAARQAVQMGREARASQRRILTALGQEVGDSELWKANQLKLRKKLIRFGKSHIHGWGLFALEDIAPDEMIVEYVGQKIRLEVAERRELNYTRRGIGSSYLFRVDAECCIDATAKGNMARFINHSCVPSCYAKIITVEGSKRIVIYSKRMIRAGDEITYDYKFPKEDVKIPCLCRQPGCRGTLN